METILDYSEKTGQFRVFVSHDDSTPDTVIPLHITHMVPMTRIPVLAVDPTGELPRCLVDELIREQLKDENLWWHGYYKERRKYAEEHAEELALADAQFRQEVYWKLESPGLPCFD